MMLVDEILEHLNVSYDTLTTLRQRGLPYSEVAKKDGRGVRFCYDPEVIRRWFADPETRALLTKEMQRRFCPNDNLLVVRKKENVWLEKKTVAQLLNTTASTVYEWQDREYSPEIKQVGNKTFYKMNVTLSWEVPK
jgi:hypothetical protein